MSVLAPHRSSRASLVGQLLEERRRRVQMCQQLDALAMILRSEQDRAEDQGHREAFGIIADIVEVIASSGHVGEREGIACHP